MMPQLPSSWQLFKYLFQLPRLTSAVCRVCSAFLRKWPIFIARPHCHCFTWPYWVTGLLSASIIRRSSFFNELAFSVHVPLLLSLPSMLLWEAALLHAMLCICLSFPNSLSGQSHGHILWTWMISLVLACKACCSAATHIFF
jgi:hypothetical protein